jgi:hypothetical protein
MPEHWDKRMVSIPEVEALERDLQAFVGSRSRVGRRNPRPLIWGRWLIGNLS